jgi:hypothetical protein
VYVCIGYIHTERGKEKASMTKESGRRYEHLVSMVKRHVGAKELQDLAGRMVLPP